ncbi:MAG: DNA alkylation repair protein [Ferruginibacter sp.]|nr:DNA alkylation repair protein [Ferruginibacter sp.]
MPAGRQKPGVQQAAPDLNAAVFLEVLQSFVNGAGVDHSKFLQDMEPAGKFMGVRMADIIKLAKEFKDMPLREISTLLDSDYYDARMGAVSIMDFQARDKKTTAAERKELYQLYLRKHNRINNGDLVDRSAPYVVGGYLYDKPRQPLYKLAKSSNVWERRTAIVATYYFIRQNDLEDTFQLAAKLIHDENDLVNKAVGSWIREAGKRYEERLLDFLDQYAATMPRVTLRYAIEKLNSAQKKRYMGMAS